MNTITADSEFHEAIAGLDARRQRVLGALFVRNVLELTDDERVRRAVEVGIDPDVADDAIAAASRACKNAALDAHARCGADGEWRDQAGYFVARAAEACLAPQVRTEGKRPAWKAAMSSRMARTALAEEADEDAHDRERQQQYKILYDYLNSQ